MPQEFSRQAKGGRVEGTVEASHVDKTVESGRQENAWSARRVPWAASCPGVTVALAPNSFRLLMLLVSLLLALSAAPARGEEIIDHHTVGTTIAFGTFTPIRARISMAAP